MGKKPTTATRPTPAARPATAKSATKTRKPRLVNEDYEIGIFGLKALIAQEEEKELVFAKEHLTIDVQGDDGEVTNVKFAGTYKELCKLYGEYGRPTGSIMRSKALLLLDKYALQIKK